MTGGCRDTPVGESGMALRRRCLSWDLQRDKWCEDPMTVGMERNGQIQDGAREIELSEVKADIEVMNRAFWGTKESTEERLFIF